MSAAPGSARPASEGYDASAAAASWQADYSPGRGSLHTSQRIPEIQLSQLSADEEGTHPMMRSFRRRIGERRISAPIRIVRAFVRAFFDSALGNTYSDTFRMDGGSMNASLGPLPSSARTMAPSTFVAFVSTNRYRLTEVIDKDLAAAMAAEADLRRDGVLDPEELTRVCCNIGVESPYLRYWCSVLNIYVDKHVDARAMPLRITKRHPVQSQSEVYEEKVLFKPDLSTTQAYNRQPVTVLRPVVPHDTAAYQHSAQVMEGFADSVDRFFEGEDGNTTARRQRALAQLSAFRVAEPAGPGEALPCEGTRATGRQPQAASINASVTMGFGADTGDERGADSAPAEQTPTFGFESRGMYDSTMTLAADASRETTGGIAPHAPRPRRVRPRPWLQGALQELCWPAVPGEEGALTMPSALANQPPAQPAFNTVFHLPDNHDVRLGHAAEFLADGGAYHPPSMHKFREEADPLAHGHAKNFERFIHNREPSLRPFERARAGTYEPPSSHKFRADSHKAPLTLTFPPKSKLIDIGNMKNEQFARLAREPMDPYRAHKPVARGITMNKMPRQTMRNIH